VLLPAATVCADGAAEMAKSGAGVVRLTLSIFAVFKTVLSCEQVGKPSVTALAMVTVIVAT
jgi:hypothetical protein